MNYITNLIQTFIYSPHTLADNSGGGAGNGFFDTFATNVKNTLSGISSIVYIVAAIAIVGIGLMCIVGSERSKEAAKSKFLYVVIGVGLVVLAVTLAQGISDMFTGNS